MDDPSGPSSFREAMVVWNMKKQRVPGTCSSAHDTHN
jgi:hypothetical protein